MVGLELFLVKDLLKVVGFIPCEKEEGDADEDNDVMNDDGEDEDDLNDVRACL